MSKSTYTPEQVAEIARRYDGTSGTIEELIKQFGGKRQNIHGAAKRGGYKTSRVRIKWTPEKDAYLRENWGKLPPDEIYAHLGVPPGATSVFSRLQRIGHSTRSNEDLTILDIEQLTNVDHRIWHRFVEVGWLRSYPEYGRNGKIWSRRVKVEWLGQFLRAHPEAFNYRAADKYARAVLELDKLPDPPRFMLVTCHSDGWKAGIRATPTGCKVHHGEVALADKHHTYDDASCAAIGGTDSWAPLYDTPSCPRCGCKVTRFSEKAMFSDDDPGDANTLNTIASKLKLTFRDGRFFAADGSVVGEEELLRYVFSTKRNPGRAFSVFRRLLEAGMAVAPPNPIPPERVLPNILRFTLRESQQQVFDTFLASGNIGVYWPPGQGKMYFLGMAFSRIPGEHLLFVNTRTVRDQWIAFFRNHGNVKVAYVKSPFHYRADIKDETGAIRSVVRIFGYATTQTFDNPNKSYGIVGFDEAQFLPGNRASRLSMLKSAYRVGLSATPFREDGRADLIQLMTGTAVGENWQEFRDAGAIPDVPVRVLIVNDLEQKHRALPHCINPRSKTIVFSDGLDDGNRIARDLDLPFIFGETNSRLEILAANKVVVMSRVGDCGIDVQDLDEVIEFAFHHGSRAQSLQRIGRLLHSAKPLRHTVLMTIKEFSLYHKRLSALEAKGFKIEIKVFKDKPRRGRPPATPKTVSAWAQLLLPSKPKQPDKPKRRYYETQTERKDKGLCRIKEKRRVATPTVPKADHPWRKLDPVHTMTDEDRLAAAQQRRDRAAEKLVA